MVEMECWLMADGCWRPAGTDVASIKLATNAPLPTAGVLPCTGSNEERTMVQH